tara:strand:+ start:42 stop:203 length:162 start_codon:yes stop_codon:yes gene_type:complete
MIYGYDNNLPTEVMEAIQEHKDYMENDPAIRIDLLREIPVDGGVFGILKVTGE